jgi:hypothetical protein
MSSSYSCEFELRKLAEELRHNAEELEDAANVLETLRNSSDLQEKVDQAKKWAKDWMLR